jgi:hypothetical protein
MDSSPTITFSSGHLRCIVFSHGIQLSYLKTYTFTVWPTTVIHERTHVLRKELVDLVDGRLQNLLGRGGDVQVQRGILLGSLRPVWIPNALRAHGGACRVVNLRSQVRMA